MTNESKQTAMTTPLEDPHQKTSLTTPIGRFVERASYTDLLMAGVGTLLLSTMYFWLAPLPHSLKSDVVKFYDAAYFSVVTFTSLGYGDLSPQGFGRTVAAIVVLLGLVFIALLVGKFASERQQSILLLIHSSDCQRRINDFSIQFHQLSVALDDSFGRREPKSTQATLKLLSERLEAASNYLVFNSNQARLVDFGNESSLLSLYDKVADLQKLCIKIHKNENEDLLTSRRSLAMANRCSSIVNLMVAFHRHAVLKTSYSGSLWKKICSFRKTTVVNSPSRFSLRVDKLHEKMKREAFLLERWSCSAVTPIIVDSVRVTSPSGPLAEWPTGTHKHIAAQLRISNSLAQKCLSQLIRSGHLPR